MLKVSKLSKSYHGVHVLRDVSFHLRAGTLNGIIGENGAGKSTLLKIIVGELDADGGAVELGGSIGYCPQEPLVFPTLTINENFQYFAAAYGLDKATNGKSWTGRRNKLSKILKFDRYADRRVDKLSGGTVQKLNLSIALLNDPDILILDEPHDGFDWQTYQSFLEMMTELKAAGKCVILVSHFISELDDFDRVLTLDQGKAW